MRLRYPPIPLALLGLLTLLALPAQAEEGPPPTIAIIIDDMGVHWDNEQRLINLEQPLTLSFLPYRRYTRQLAEAGNQRGKEIMLHSPMENNARIGLGPGGLSMAMEAGEMAAVLRRSLASVPHARGVNNHMGSLLTQQESAMGWVMDELAQHPVFFVDSRTIASTVAADMAESRNIPNLSRDVFLDHERDRDFIHSQFQRLLRQAREEGTAVAIGHPYEETVSYLEEMLPQLDEMGYAVATVSAVWAMRNGHVAMFQEEPSAYGGEPSAYGGEPSANGEEPEITQLKLRIAQLKTELDDMVIPVLPEQAAPARH
ncbi:MAG: divergent polysaccharide deacetylase family protein [Halomonadaceae bacterium]|nr:MAG: divergent polysaccharide deacetylase family protein [Halomonadaceae bacterium]